MVQTVWIQTAWVEAKAVKVQIKIVAIMENQNKEKTKMQKRGLCNALTLFRSRKPAVKRTKNSLNGLLVKESTDNV